MVKIGAYYHDIGKIVEPQCFNENYHQESSPIHNKISPEKSAKKIINHVVYGIQLARKFKLGKSITKFIMEHHGDSLIYFFYEKCCKQSKKKVSEKSFRYPMPRPSSVETAIVMLADTSEVSVRSLKKPTKKNITSMINSIFQKIMEEKQLDFSNISVLELRILKEVFIDILTSLNHDRILGKKA